MAKRLSKEQYVEGILSGNRIVLSRAITLIESKLDSDNQLAAQIISEVLPKTGNSIRIGITGVPGAGKSTFIESFGTHLTEIGKKVAVLAIDPSSSKTKGSILGDKTRMENLSVNQNAFIRPSPSQESLGGVAAKTRETILLCEAAGYNVIIVETVGVGQSEIEVKNMTDFFLLLMIAGAGDELQGIKKGIMEMADALLINKADGQNIANAKNAQQEYQNALHLFPANANGWITPVETCSSIENTGIDNIWKIISKYENSHTDYILNIRQNQNLLWLKKSVDDYIKKAFYDAESIQLKFADVQSKILKNELSVFEGVKILTDNNQ